MKSADACFVFYYSNILMFLALLVQDVLCSGRLIIILCHNVSSFSTEKQLFLVDLMVKTS